MRQDSGLRSDLWTPMESIGLPKSEIHDSGVTATLPGYGMRVREWLATLESPTLRAAYLDFYDSHNTIFEQVSAGARHHHWWRGGLEQHTAEVIAIAAWLLTSRAAQDFQKLLAVLPTERAWALAEVKPTLDDVIVAGFLHDFPKIWTYRERSQKPEARSQNNNGRFEFTNEAIRLVQPEDKLLMELARFGIVPTEAQWGAVLFHEGGWSQRHFGWQGRTATSETAYSANPLAVIIHAADLWSSQILGRGIA